MTMVCCTVYDVKAEMYLEPFWAPTIEFAIRGFREAVNTPGHQFAKWPEDYTLFHIGTFDQKLGTFSPELAPYSLGTAFTYKQVSEGVMA